MKRPFFVVLAVYGLCLTACTSIQPKLVGSTRFLPALPLLKTGIVNKYYLHFDGIDSQETATTIEYRSYVFTDGKQVLQKHYDPAFMETGFKVFAMAEDSLVLQSEQQFFRNDTVDFAINQGIYLALGQGRFVYKKTNGKSANWTRTQTTCRDTLLPEGNAIIVEGILSTQKYANGDTVQSEMTYHEVYAPGIGLFSAKVVSEEGITQLELVEQMPLAQFDQLASHELKRIGFIDPATSLFPNLDFKPCGAADDIVDYYNGDPDAGYKEGKYGLWQILEPQIDTRLLAGESGYLTFRFVINCTGQTGWFVTEMADLDYTKKVFPQNLVNHLGQLLAALDSFQPTIVRGETRDAYAYLTFKLDHGSIIDLLP